jgi:hypothetical protein
MAISVVQTVKSNTATTTIASTGSGNTLVVTFNSFKSSGTPSVTSVTLGGTDLTQAKAVTLNSSGEFASYIYYLGGIASGQTSVVISGTNLVFTSGNGGVCIYEISGLGALDKTNSGSSASATTYSSGATGTLSQASELVIGTANVDVSGGTLPSGFTNTTDSGDSWVSGYQIVSATTSVTYTGSTTDPPWTAAIASFKGLSNISVALTTATSTIAAYSPSIPRTIGLSTATVAIAAYPPSPSTATVVALSTATVSVAALAPGLEAGPVSLTTASVAISAHSPTATTSVLLSTATVSIAAYAVTPHVTRSLPVATVAVSAPAPSVVITRPDLIISIAPQGGTDPVSGVTYPEGIMVGAASAGPQVGLVPSADGPAELQFPISSLALSQPPTIAGNSVGTFAEMNIDGPQLSQSGVDDWIQLNLFSSVEGSDNPTANMQFVYIPEGGGIPQLIMAVSGNGVVLPELGEFPATPTSGCCIFYSEGVLYALGTSGDAVAIAST